MTQAGKVAEIFSVAGEAFTKLGNLAMSLQPANTQDGGKWEDEEIDMLRKAVAQFGNDIEKISEKIKTKSAMQIKNTLKHKAIQNLNVTPTIRNTSIQPQKPTVTTTTQIQNLTVKTTTSPAGYNASQRPPGLQHIAIKTPAMSQTAQSIANVNTVTMKPTLMSIQGQNFSVKPQIMTISTQQQNINVRPPLMTVSGQNLTMKPTGVATPASIITSQLNKTPMKIQNIPRTIGQKTKVDTISVTGMMSADVQNNTKKVKLESPNLNILTSTLLSQKPMIRSQTPGIPGVVSSQGFQVLMPSSSSKNIYPISVRPSGIVQRVADANTTTGNVDVES